MFVARHFFVVIFLFGKLFFIFIFCKDFYAFIIINYYSGVFSFLLLRSICVKLVFWGCIIFVKPNLSEEMKFFFFWGGWVILFSFSPQLMQLWAPTIITCFPGLTLLLVSGHVIAKCWFYIGVGPGGNALMNKTFWLMSLRWSQN